MSNEVHDAYVKRLEKVLAALVKDVDDAIDDLDPCWRDCSKFHHLTLDSLPAAKALLKEPDAPDGQD